MLLKALYSNYSDEDIPDLDQSDLNMHEEPAAEPSVSPSSSPVSNYDVMHPGSLSASEYPARLLVAVGGHHVAQYFKRISDIIRSNKRRN